MAHQIAIVETAQPSAQREIAAAWHACQQTEHHGLEFGRVCFEWKSKLRSKGGYGSKGKGLSEILTVLNIPRHKVDYWSDEYQISAGLMERPITKPKLTSDDRYRKLSAFVGNLYAKLPPKERTAEIHGHIERVMRAY
jgi:hypothetical protein